MGVMVVFSMALVMIVILTAVVGVLLLSLAVSVGAFCRRFVAFP